MKTLCKFKCDSVTDNVQAKSVVLTPVYSQDLNSENKKFWEYTPSGKLELSWINKNVEFVPGKEYYVEISLAEISK